MENAVLRLFKRVLLVLVMSGTSVVIARRAPHKAMVPPVMSAVVAHAPSIAQPSLLVTSQPEMTPQKPITDEWKTTTHDSFKAHNAYIQNIILRGEGDQAERADYERLFGEQQQWLDQTISSTAYFFDPAYNAAMQKHALVEKLVAAQRRADEKISAAGFPDQIAKKARLVVLYELSARINAGQTVEAEDVAAILANTFQGFPAPRQSDHASTATSEVASKPIATSPDTLLSLQKRINELQQQLLQEKDRVIMLAGKEQELAHARNELSNVKAQLVQNTVSHAQHVSHLQEQARKEVLVKKIELERAQKEAQRSSINVTQLSGQLTNLKAQVGALSAGQVAMRQKLNRRIEAKNKELVELKIAMNKAHEHAHDLSVAQAAALKSDFALRLEEQRKHVLERQIELQKVQQELEQTTEQLGGLKQRESQARMQSTNLQAQLIKQAEQARLNLEKNKQQLISLKVALNRERDKPPVHTAEPERQALVQATQKLLSVVNHLERVAEGTAQEAAEHEDEELDEKQEIEASSEGEISFEEVPEQDEFELDFGDIK